MKTKSCDMEIFFKFKKAGFTNDESFKLARKAKNAGIKTTNIKLMSIGGLLPAIGLMQVDAALLENFISINAMQLINIGIVELISYNLIKMVVDIFSIKDKELLKKELISNLVKCFLGVSIMIVTPRIICLLIDLASKYSGVPIKHTWDILQKYN